MSETTTENIEEQSTTINLANSEYHRLLADDRNRVVLDILVKQEDTLTLTDLATAVEAQETNDNTTKGDAREEVQIALHHKHLPMMAERDLVDYDSEAKRVEPNYSTLNLLTA